MRGRTVLLAVVGAASAVGVVVLARRTGTEALNAAVSPNWLLLAAGFTICAGVQPLRAWAWSSTVRSPVGFRAVYAASSLGSFLDTVLPGRLGEVSKVAVLKVASGSRWPGFPRAGGSLLCAHLLEAIAFAIVGAGAAIFLPLPTWARATVVIALLLFAVGLGLTAALHKRLGDRLPASVSAFVAGAAAPRRVLLQAGAILIVTWVARWFGILFLLQAVGVKLGIGAALVYMVVTGLANTAPILPGNVGIYQGAAIGALAMVGHSGAHAVAASVFTPVVISLATATAAAAGLALYGRRFATISRAALVRPT
ncbi:MAG: flippase-like domain-containing protein [Actinomycetota bacterium]|nr:flippase-like domain-containing protein [Actinomycetota bacterium]